MELNSLTSEQKAKLKSCKDPEELRSMLKSLGIELSDEQLDAVAGGENGDECDQFANPNCHMLISSDVSGLSDLADLSRRH